MRHCSVRISSRGAALLSRLLNISLTMDRRFQMPSGSRPLKGRRRHAHSAAAGGSVDDRYMEFTSLRPTQAAFSVIQSRKVTGNLSQSSELLPKLGLIQLSYLNTTGEGPQNLCSVFLMLSLSVDSSKYQVLWSDAEGPAVGSARTHTHTQTI